jgi:hypothetical protein
MPLFPYDTLQIDSPLSADAALARLRQATGPQRWFRFGTPQQPFEGEVSADAVRIRRAIGYQNAWLPRIRGRIEPRAAGCRLHATLSLHPAVAVFIVVWFGGALMMIPPALALVLAGGPPGGLVITPVMLLFGWGLCSGAFTFEAWAARERLAALLEAVRPADRGREYQWSR